MGNFSGMTEGIIMALLFVVLAGAVIGYLNVEHGQSYSVGLDTSGLDNFYSATQTAYDATTGEVTQTSDGFSLSSSWKMLKGLTSTAWSFINGSWINTLITQILMIGGVAGYTIAMVIRILFLGLILWTIIKVFFKVDA
jgi:hypothetical protein